MQIERDDRRSRCGWTLLELLVSLLVGMIFFGGVYSVYAVQLRTYANARARSNLYENLRGALMVLEQELRMAGYDPEGTGRFGIVDVRRYDLIANRPNAAGVPALFFTADADENGQPDSRNHHRNREHLNFRVRRDSKTGRYCLAFDNGAGRQTLAEYIKMVGFAYAVDTDEDRHPDCWRDGDHLVWAVDSDNDNLLDSHLDANDDGRIDGQDDINGDGRIDPADGGGLMEPVALARIVAVRVWLLAVSAPTPDGGSAGGDLTVGDRIIRKRDAGRFYRVLETTIAGRNL